MIKQMQQKALKIFDLYGELRKAQGQRQWTKEEVITGFTGDIGDLAKLSMIKAGIRGRDPDIDEKIAHEITDCLWSTLMLAHFYNVDLEKEFPKTMDSLDCKIRKKLEEEKK